MGVSITSLKAREVLDSRGNPTVEVDAVLSDGSFGRASVPSGASTGSHEALEMRDGDKSRYGGKGVLKAVEAVNGEIAEKLRGMDAGDQRAIDETMLSLDGTELKTRLGANAILAVSLAVCRAAAAAHKVPIYKWIRTTYGLSYSNWVLPTPMMNIMNGGKHAEGASDIQEFMILPAGASRFSEGLRWGAEVFQVLKSYLHKEGFPVEVGDEGGFAPRLGSNQKAFDVISSVVEKAGYRIGADIYLGIDAAASEFYEGGKYNLSVEGKQLTAEELLAVYTDWRHNYPIITMEDPFFEDDWSSFAAVTAGIGANTQIVGDDLFVTNTKRLIKGIEEKAGNAILVKVNQIGSLTETVDVVLKAQEAGYNSVISHRSGETEDSTIADIAVALNAGQIKTGSLSRTDRIAKYNQLLRIEEELGSEAEYAGKAPFEKYGI